jgi:hypothetical protein
MMLIRNEEGFVGRIQKRFITQHRRQSTLFQIESLDIQQSDKYSLTAGFD